MFILFSLDGLRNMSLVPNTLNHITHTTPTILTYADIILNSSKGGRDRKDGVNQSFWGIPQE